MAAPQKLKLLYGDALVKKQQECELQGFTDTVKSILQRLADGKVNEINRCEVMYILNKLNG